MPNLIVPRERLVSFLGDDLATIRQFESVFKNIFITLTGDVTGNGMGTFVTTISPGVVTLGKMAPLAPVSLIGNSGSEGATPQALTGPQATAMLSVFTSTLQGLVPPSGGGTLTFQRADGSWAVPPAAGPAAGDLAGDYPNPTVAGLLGHPLPPLAVGYPNWTGTAWAFVSAPYTLPAATSTALGGVKPDGTSIANTAGAISLGTTQTGTITWSGLQTFNYGFINIWAVTANVNARNFSIGQSQAYGQIDCRISTALNGDPNSAGISIWFATAALFTFNVSVNVPAGKVYQVAGVQVLGAQQAGLGATLASTHVGATYTATEQGLINALIDKVVLLETKLKAHGLVAT